jgi:hypothetical protein
MLSMGIGSAYVPALVIVGKEAPGQVIDIAGVLDRLI